MKDLPALLRLKASGYELVAYRLADIPRNAAFTILARNYRP